MTMTGTIPDPTDPTRRVPWKRCADGARLYDAWVDALSIDASIAPAFAMVEIDGAWIAYQAHVRECDECGGRSHD